jgi:hypothetical protein
LTFLKNRADRSKGDVNEKDNKSGQGMLHTCIWQSGVPNLSDDLSRGGAPGGGAAEGGAAGGGAADQKDTDPKQGMDFNISTE